MPRRASKENSPLPRFALHSPWNYLAWNYFAATAVSREAANCSFTFRIVSRVS
jgi:hypothetical protein